jgi:hypothetical protein
MKIPHCPPLVKGRVRGFSYKFKFITCMEKGEKYSPSDEDYSMLKATKCNV